MSNLDKLMSMNAEDTPDPVEVSEGQFRFNVKTYKVDEVGENKTPKVTVIVGVTGVIDADKFDPANIPNATPVRMEFWGTDKALAQRSAARSLKQFLCGALELPEELPYGELLEMSINSEFVGQVKIEMEGRDNDIPTPRINRIIT